MSEPKLLATFGKPFKYQVAAFRLRLTDLRDTARWTDLWQAEHDRAFMVAGATKAGILADLAAAVDKAIAQGTGLEAFKRDFRKIVAEKGWLMSPAGQGKDGKGAWRARLIYRTNMSTSYAAGRMAQLVAADYPFWVYRHGASLEPRLQHLAWDGLILAPDHLFWASHAPPNGWGCSCYVVGARSMAAAKILGGKPGLELPDDWQAPDPRTGAPTGIDKGWAYAPGASVASTVGAMAEKVVHWPYEIAKAFMQAVPENHRDDLANAYRELRSTEDAIRRYVASIPATGGVEAADPMRTLGLVTSQQIDQLLALTGVDVTGFDFAIDAPAIRHVFNKHGDPASEARRGQRAVTVDDFIRLLQILRDPEVVSLLPAKGATKQVQLERVIDGQRHVAIFELRTKRHRLSLATMWVMLTGRPLPNTPLTSP